MRHVAVVGASLAGLRAAEALRDQGFDGRLTIVGDEPHAPYDRPPLSKDFLLGKSEAADIALCDAALRDSLAADWRLGVSASGLEDGVLALGDGDRLAADGFVLATGARARTLAACPPGVHTLRTLDDAAALRADLASARHLVIVGAGFVGMEVASAAVALGARVTVVDTAAAPFRNRLGPVAADLLLGVARDHGVDLRTGVGSVVPVGAERVTGISLDDAAPLPVDLVLAGIGAIPNTEWLAGSGVDCDGGVLVDGWGRTRTRGVVAAGDVARPTGAARTEHWTHARDTPATAVRALLADTVGGDPGPPPDSAYFWSEQFGHRIQLAGRLDPDAPVDIVDGAIEEARFVGVQRRDGALTAVLGWSMPREFTRLRRRNDADLRATAH